MHRHISEGFSNQRGDYHDMRIESVTLSNSQSYGEEPTTVQLDDLTALIGTNGSGKTALLQALLRVFGISTARLYGSATPWQMRSETDRPSRSARALPRSACVGW